MNNKDKFKEYFNTDYSIIHKIDTSWETKEFHFHDVYEVYFSLTDNIKYFVNEKVYPIRKGDLLVFNNIDLHKTVVSKDTKYERYVIIFKPEYINQFSTINTNLLECFINRKSTFCHCIHLSSQQSQVLLSLITKAENYFNNKIYGQDIYKKISLIEILLKINSLYKSCTTSVPLKFESEYRRIQPVLKYINNNLNKSLSLDHLSSTFFLSKYHLNCLFKKATGFTINEYIINNRIIKAKELLQKDLTVSQVCEITGFNNYSHFIRTFKRMVGLTPKQYAKK